GREYPWIPSRLRKARFNFTKYEKSILKISAFTHKIDILFQRRLEFLTTGWVKYIIALITIILSTVIVVVGFIPFLPIFFALTILFFGLGLMTHDGLMIIAGLFILLATLFVLPYSAFQWMK
ncbi:MAG: exopolysaccharide biosynthesis protein, partial [Alphaproteobacteria bacterium]